MKYPRPSKPVDPSDSWTDDPNELSELATVIRDLFVEYRVQYTGQARYSPNSRFNKYFENAAKIVEELGVSPQDFVHAQFEGLRASPNLHPNILSGAGAKDRYHAYYDSNTVRDEAYRVVYDQLGFLKSLSSLGKTPEDILKLDDTRFDPLFVCVIARMFKLEELYSRRVKEAASFIKLNPVFKAVYKNMLSASDLSSLSDLLGEVPV